MTNTIIQHVEMLSDEDLIDKISKIQGNKKSNAISIVLKNHYSDIFNEIFRRTSFLDNAETKQIATFQERLYCIKNQIKSIPKCAREGCDHSVRWYQNSHKFNIYCSIECTNKDQARIEKSKSTCIKNHGVAYPLQSKNIQQKCKDSLIRNHGVENCMYIESVKTKVKETNMKRGGNICSLHTPYAKIKTQQTLNDRYGGHYSKTKEYKAKFLKTSQEKFHTNHPMQNKDVRQKQMNTTFEHHGYYNFAQSPEYHKKAHKKYVNPKYPDMTFGSSWEFLVYDFLIENHIDFEYQPEISFHYEYKGIYHTYHPDFIVYGRVFEVKGDNFFRINESTGKEEMFCPYRDEDWLDEKYDWMCGLYEAKHQCMIANDVIVLREKEINNLSISIFLV